MLKIIMNANVHMSVAAATTTTVLLVTGHTDPKLLTTGLVCSMLGSIVPDVDANDESKFKNMFKKFMSVFIIILIAFGFYAYNNHITVSDAIRYILNCQWLTGGLIFIVLCLIGYFSSHRTFTHWLIAIPMFSLGFYMMFGKIPTIFFAIGMLSHLIIDLLNKKEQKLFFPIPIDCCLYVCESDSGLSNLIGVSAFCLTVFEIYKTYGEQIVLFLYNIST